MHKFFAIAILSVMLVACGSEEERIDGRWFGKISDEARRELRIEGAFEGDLLIVEFEPDRVHLNDTVRLAEYSSNRGRTLVKFADENRVMTIYHDEEDPNAIRMNAVSYYSAKIFRFDLIKDPG